MTLADIGEELAHEAAFWLSGALSPSYPLPHLGRLSIDVCTKLRALAIAVLLVKADVDRFHHNLIRSALVREAYLRRCRDEGAPLDHHRASGRTAGLLDAIAASAPDIARRIVALSPTDLHKGHEYEDDYCFAQVLHRLVMPTPPEAEILPLLERWAEYPPASSDARLEVCRALLTRDQAAFDEAFESLLNRRDDQISAEKARNKLEEPAVVAERHVYVEGLAVLRLAAARGLVTQSEYRMCPSLARLPMTQPFPGE